MSSYRDLLEDDETPEYAAEVQQAKTLRKQQFHHAYSFGGVGKNMQHQQQQSPASRSGYRGASAADGSVGGIANDNDGGNVIDEDAENAKYNAFQERQMQRRSQQQQQQQRQHGGVQYHLPAGEVSPERFSESVERLRDRQKEMEAKLARYQAYQCQMGEQQQDDEDHHHHHNHSDAQQTPHAARGGHQGGSSSVKHLPSPHPDVAPSGGTTLPRTTPGRHPHFNETPSPAGGGGGGALEADFSNCAPSTIHSSPYHHDGAGGSGTPFYGTPRTGAERIGMNHTPSSHHHQQQQEHSSPYTQFKSLAEVRQSTTTNTKSRSAAHRSGGGSNSNGGVVKPPFATHFASPTVYTAPMGPEESTGLMDRYGYRYEGPGDADVASQEKSSILQSRIEKDQQYSGELEHMMIAAKVKAFQSRKDLHNCAEEPSQLSLQLGNDVAARKERSRLRRAELEKQWLVEAEEKRVRDKAEADALKPVEEDWNMLEDIARMKALEDDTAASRLKRQQQDALELWQNEQNRVAEEKRAIEDERRRIAELTLSPNVANYADRIVLAEQQKRRDREAYKRDLDAQIQAKHARNRQLAQEEYERECRLGTY